MHSAYLQQALHLAQQRRGFCAPNPAVGAIVVKNERILAEGLHWAAGKPHAEVDALSKLSQEESVGATVYITLEPCCHFGKTPPCVDLLIERKVKAVYYAFQDPNPLVGGKSEAKLRAAGITCAHLPVREIDTFYRSYNYWTLHKRPWVTVKLACSLDGKIAGQNGEPLSITGEPARHFTHQGRKQADAILTTVETLLKDDPQLNVRLEGETYQKPLYVLDSQLRLLPTLRIFNTSAKLTVFHAENVVPPQNLQIRYIAVAQEYGRLSLNQILDQIGQDGMHDLWVEAGGVCFSSFVTQKLAHRAYIYVAPKWLGSHAQTAFSDDMVRQLEGAKQISWQTLGQDGVCELLWD